MGLIHNGNDDIKSASLTIIESELNLNANTSSININIISDYIILDYIITTY